MSSKLSVILITLDEERDLPDCLASVAGLHADMEIVVVDNHSADKTRDIAQAAGARVTTRTFDDYAAQRQASLDAAAGAWALWIDADERLSPELHAEIKELLAGEPEAGAYDIPFAVEFMGRTLRWGGLGGEHHVRLFRRAGSRFVGGAVHEGVTTPGPTRRLRGRMRHIPYADLDEYLAKLPVYTRSAALKRYAAGRRFSALDHLRPLWELFMRLVLKGGLLDGTPGIIWAGLAAAHTWIKYARLHELEEAA